MTGGFAAARDAFTKREKEEKVNKEPMARIKKIADIFTAQNDEKENVRAIAFSDDAKISGPSVKKAASIFEKEEQEKKSPEKTAQERFADAAKKFNKQG